MSDGLVTVIVDTLPSAIALIRVLFRRQNPAAPEPTDAEVVAAYGVALQSSLDKDARWLAAHPDA